MERRKPWHPFRHPAYITNCSFSKCFTVINSSHAEEIMKHLVVIEGGSITLPDAVVEKGFLNFGNNVIAMVSEEKLETYEEMDTGTVLWNKTTGLFTITRLQKINSGIYHINSKKGRLFAVSYNVTVYGKLQFYLQCDVHSQHSQSPHDENCTLACFVKKTEETTLLWFKNEEIVNQSSSGISLLVKVLEQDFGSSYRCVVSNPADEQSIVVDGKIFCSEQNSTDSRKFQCEFSRFKGYCHWPMLFGVFC
uniref:Ig-like domain-containing protein n=1 Tax=Mola mola TaxID=94237 RepID=A0A3Q3WK52_MOLML